MLKKIRVVLAAFFLIALTLLSLDYTGAIHAYLGWCAKMQFVPARLSVSDAIVAGVILMTLLLGRVYCSVICPLGIYQDVVSRIAGIRKKVRFAYRPPRRGLVVLRISLFVVFLMAAALHFPVVTNLLEPYSAYGRMVSQIFGPLYQWGNNILAYFAERSDSYAFYTVDVWLRSVSVLGVAVLTFLLVSVFAWKSGRGYCSGVCPVGVFLGLFARSSVMKMRIDKEKCSKCGICVNNCKAGCIDPNDMEIDYFRCVTCFNCKDACPKKAVDYAVDGCLKKSFGMPSGKKSGGTNAASDVKVSSDMKTSANTKIDTQKDLAADNLARRGLLAGIALTLAGLAARVSARQFDGGLVALEDKQAPARAKPVLPPGSDSAKNHRARCTACQLCVTVCANHVLRPSSKISEYMQPHLTFERGYCRPECVKCSQACPTGAIRPITAAEKTSIQTGIAVWNADLCVVNRDKVFCDLCARKCPAGAITMIAQSAEDASSPKIPMIDTARCIGCGACENLCPSRPKSAIYVDGVDVHRTI
ncbi:MAG: 4Fe-4S dicluster domain-containing protein [Chitinispirillia bacterium]|nr:4Fe-4S dicluster domain-containing protein [Chitinispirillia bacterium]MCL2241806.1 4Fe-4S dicluster domain-containing protein [Chitinispirillia bacterium]